MKKNSYDAAIERRNRETRDIFEKAAQEKVINPTSVGISGSFTQYNLHNYRLYFSYKKPNQTDLMTSVNNFTYTGSRNYGHELVYRHSSGYQITIKKTQVEIKKKHEARDWHMIDNAHPEEITRINAAKQGEAVSVFREFVKAYGGQTDFNIINEYKIDNALKNALTRKIPLREHWEDDVTKKLYKEDKIEAKKEQYAKNFCHNTGLYEFSPAIAGSLDRMSKSMEILDALTRQIELHLKVEAHTNELLESILKERLGTGEGKTSTLSPLQSKVSMPSPPHNIRDDLPEGWFD